MFTVSWLEALLHTASSGMKADAAANIWSVGSTFGDDVGCHGRKKRKWQKYRVALNSFHSEVTQATNTHVSLAKASHATTPNFNKGGEEQFYCVLGSGDVRPSTTVGKYKWTLTT